MKKKYILSADWHIRASNPRIRKDNYYLVQYQKVEWVLKEAKKRDADVIIAGDIFDAPRCPWWLISMYISLFIRFENMIWVIPGQHDMHNHNPDISNTPLGVLLKAELVFIPQEEDGIIGVPWKEDIPDGHYNDSILVIHKCITPDDPPFFLNDAISADQMLDEYGDKFDLIVSGDYHQGHVTISESCTLCNPGPIMRASKDKMEYIPRVYFYDYDVGSIEMLEIPIDDLVFNEDAIEADENKEYSNELKELAETITGKREIAKFEDALKLVVHSMDPSKAVSDIVDEVWEEYKIKDEEDL